jgi:hypothetical protein
MGVVRSEDVVNGGKSLPPSPDHPWGTEIPEPALVPSYDEHVLDVARARELRRQPT